MTRRSFLVSAAGAAALANQRQPNVLFLFSDDQRADTIAALGNRYIRTPNLDGLVRSGVSFTNCFVSNPICTPSRATVQTGCNDFHTGVRWFGEKVRPGLPFWAQTMKDAGYQTFYSGKWHNEGSPKDFGFDIEDRVFPKGMGSHEMTLRDRNGREVSGYSSELFADAAVEYLASKPKAPFFAQISFTAPHDPRTPPEKYTRIYDPREIPLPKNFLPEHPFDNGELDIRDEKLLPRPRTEEAVRKELANYYAMITHLDEQIGRILNMLNEAGQSANTIVIFSADHGLAIGSHGLLGKMSMYDHSLRPPLIIRAPGTGKPGTRTAALCYLHDLFPTAADLAGASLPRDKDQPDGLSLKPLLDGSGRRLRDAVFSSYRDVQRMARTDRWKLIWYPKIEKTQLFDMAGDPYELHDVYDRPEHARLIGRLRGMLRNYQQISGDRPLIEA
ncbi:MAG: sulfatase-like hydrolase/transferase [Bryobacteraceae bacterium]